MNEDEKLSETVNAPHNCDKCEYKTKKRSNLQRHKECVHEGIRWSCEQCDHTASDKGNLKKHIRSVHENIFETFENHDYKANWKAQDPIDTQEHKISEFMNAKIELSVTIQNLTQISETFLQTFEIPKDTLELKLTKLRVAIETADILLHSLNDIFGKITEINGKKESHEFNKYSQRKEEHRECNLDHKIQVNEVSLNQPEIKEEPRADFTDFGLGLNEDLDSKKYELQITQNDTNPTYHCAQCEYKSSKKSNFRRHKESVHEGVRYPCELCNYKASDKSNLKHHINSTHEGLVKSLGDIFSEGYNEGVVKREWQQNEKSRKRTKRNSLSKKTEANDFLISQPAIKEEPFTDFTGFLTCSNETEFEHKKGDSEEVKQHIKQKEKNATYNCDQCTYKTKKKSNLQRHKEMHDGVRHLCDQCDFQATEKGYLTKHIRSVHEGIRYPCAECGYKATRPDVLKSHILSVHEGVSYLCDKCDYKAKEMGKLRRHVLTIHEGVRYPCKQCDYKATRKDYLNAHVQSKHVSK